MEIKTFNELTTKELYEILRLRAEIFVVEQNCVYQDLDGIDYNSVHIFYEDNGRVLAYLRFYPLDENTVSLGRVVTLYHKSGFGGKILKIGLDEIKKRFNPQTVVIHAQCQAKGFYEKFGFKETSDVFLEDEIEHIEMKLYL
jgi:ElaA protein